MEEYNKYAALADTIKIEDIASCERKQSILQQIKDNDPDLTQLWICTDDQIEDYRDYSPDSAVELAWLGYFLGCNSTVKELCISRSLIFDNSGKDVFRRGLGNNKSIYQLNLEGLNVSDGQMLRMLDLFMKNNNKLSEFVVVACQAGVEGLRQLSLAVGDCNQSLKHVSFRSNEIVDGHLVDIITAMSMHPQLTKLKLTDNGTMGRNECTALSTLLRCTTTRLQKLDLDCNGINDEGVEVLVNALANGNHLKELYLGSNESITSRGWSAVAHLLQLSGSTIKKLSVGCNDIGDEGALVFANALTNNSTLKVLNLYRCGITDEGWAPFSRLLCDASSVNNTYMSNHTLEEIRKTNDPYVNKYALLNKREDKQQVAMSKILQRHSHFDMQPFFEWEFKVLPIMIEWFTKAAARVTTYEQKISRLRLSGTFDFIKEFPMVYIEPVTRKKIAEYTDWEELLEYQMGNQAESAQLEEIRRCKARAMRRL